MSLARGARPGIREQALDTEAPTSSAEFISRHVFFPDQQAWAGHCQSGEASMNSQ